MDKDLIILVCYINVAGQSAARARQTIQQMMGITDGVYDDVTDKNVKIHYMPVTDQDTRMECIYPPSNSNNLPLVENELLKFYKQLVDIKFESVDEIKNIIRTLERKIKINNIRQKNEND